MFLNSSIGISEGVRATLFLRDCRKRNIIHRGGVDIKWNGPTTGNMSAVRRLLSPYNRLSKQSFVRFLYGVGPVARLAASPLKVARLDFFGLIPSNFEH